MRQSHTQIVFKIFNANEVTVTFMAFFVQDGQLCRVAEPENWIWFFVKNVVYTVSKWKMYIKIRP